MNCCAQAAPQSKEQLSAVAQTFRNTYKAPRMADFIDEAADIYERRGVFTRRY